MTLPEAAKRVLDDATRWDARDPLGDYIVGTEELDALRAALADHSRTEAGGIDVSVIPPTGSAERPVPPRAAT